MTDPPLLRDFACCHEEGEAECEALRSEVCAALGCEPDRLVTAVVQDLNWSFDVYVTGIPNDMWSAVKSERRRYPPNGDGVLEATAYIECDLIEDGFALTWKTWKEWTGANKGNV